MGFEARLLASLGAGVLAVDREGVVRVLNPGAQRILGLAEDAGVGRHLQEVLRDEPALARALLRTLRRKAPVSRAELSLARAADGGARKLGLSLVPVTGDAGEAIGAAACFRDLSPIEQDHEQARLRERLAALGETAAGLAHAVRNPLAGMRVVADLLRRRLAERPGDRELVEDLCRELHRLGDTVTACLEFVRPHAPALDRVDPVELLEDAVAAARAQVDFAGVVERSWKGDLPPLEGDREQLRIALTDLVLNAVQATRETEEPRITLSLGWREIERPVLLAADGDAAARVPVRELVIGVEDNGPGVPEDLREKIFYPFFTTRERGSGVGLASAQKIVDGHGGKLELETRPGYGAIFRIHLPVAQGCVA